MKILFIQNYEIEGFGYIENYMNEQSIDYTIFYAYSGKAFPTPEDYDAFIIGGTPLSVNDLERYDFLQKEREFLVHTLNLRKPHLGICFGSQLLAKILGASVRRNPVLEIGVYEVELTSDGTQSEFFRDFPTGFPVFQWHGDTFDIPKDALHLVTGKDCINQAFSYQNNIGIQFHFEVDTAEVSKWAVHYQEELKKFGKTKEEIVQECREHEDLMKSLAYKFLDNFLNAQSCI